MDLTKRKERGETKKVCFSCAQNSSSKTNLLKTLSRIKPIEDKYGIKLIGTYNGIKNKNQFQCSCGEKIETVPYRLEKKDVRVKDGSCFCKSIIKPIVHSSQSRKERKETVEKLLLDKGLKFEGWQDNKRNVLLPKIACSTCSNIFSRDYKVLLKTENPICKPCGNRIIAKTRNSTFSENDIKEFIIKNQLKNAIIKDKNVLSYDCKTCSSKIEYDFANLNRSGSNILNCSSCRMSRGQEEIGNFLKSLNVTFESNNREILKRPNGKNLEIDIFVPAFNLGIEFNGDYWHSELAGLKKDYHINKLKIAKENGIELIQIFEKDWNKKREIIESLIKSKVGIKNQNIFARKCSILEIKDKKIVKEFLDANHIQGNAPFKLAIGATYNGELVSLITLGKSRYDKNFYWELIRYTNKRDTNMSGIFSRLLKNFEKNYNSKSLISYSDNRYFSGQVYKNNGFLFSHLSKPNYFYFKGNSDFFSRQKFQKHKLSKLLENFDPKKTEWENMRDHGWNRIYDAGNKVWIKKY